MNIDISRREFVQRSSVIAASLAGVPWMAQAAEARRLFDFDAVRKPLATFAVVTDTHFAVRPDGKGEHPYLAPALQTINDVQAAGADFIVHLGDIINSFPTASQFPAEVKLAREQLAASRTKIYTVPGNHDIGHKPTMTTPKMAADRVRQEWVDFYRQQFGADYHVIDRAGCRVILLNSMLFNTGLPAERQQWERLRGDLADAKGAKVTLGFHVPLFWYRPDDTGPNNYEVIDEPARGQLLELIRQHKVRAVFTGHTHQPIVNTYGEALLLTAPSTTFARTFGFYPDHQELNREPTKRGWLLVRVYDNDIVVNRFRPPVGAGALVTRQSSENAGCHLATTVWAPRLFAGPWSPNNVADGKRASATHDPREEQLIGWSSTDAAQAECREWVRLTFAEPVTFDRVMLWPRFHANGSAFNFPTEFAVQATADGKNWTTLKQFSSFHPEPNEPVTVRVAPQQALAIAVAASRVPGNGAKPPAFYFQVMEFEVFNGQQQLRASAVHASSSAYSLGPRRLDNPLLEAADLGARYVRVAGAINTEDFRHALLTAVRLGQRPVVSLPPEPRIVRDAVRALGGLAALIEAPDAETFRALLKATGEKSRVMVGPALPEKIADALALEPLWISVALDGNGKTGRALAQQMIELRKTHPKNVFWFDVVNGPVDPADVAQLFLLTYGMGVIINPLPATAAGRGALLDRNYDPTPAHTALRMLAAVLGEPRRPAAQSQRDVTWLRFASAPDRYVEALWTDGRPVRMSLGAERAGASVVDLATGLARPLPADSQVSVGRLPVLVCKL